MALPEAGEPSNVDVLYRSLTDLVAESRGLRGDVHEAERARKRTNKIWLAALGVLSLFVGMLLVITWQNNHLVAQVHQTNEFISDCTVADGKCYQENSRRTGEAISDIIRAEIYMAQCARLFPGDGGPGYDRRLEACVYARLAEAARQRAAGNPNPTPTVTAPPSPGQSGAPR